MVRYRAVVEWICISLPGLGCFSWCPGRVALLNGAGSRRIGAIIAAPTRGATVRRALLGGGEGRGVVLLFTRVVPRDAPEARGRVSSVNSAISDKARNLSSLLPKR